MNDETPTADNEPKPEAPMTLAEMLATISDNEPTPEPPMSFAEVLAQFDRVLDKMDATKQAMANMQADLRYIKAALS